MGKNVFVLHSLNGDTLEYWGLDVKQKMADKGIEFFMPEFPVRAESSFEKFDFILSKFLGGGNSLTRIQ
ncbi:MAG: hypothetical protein FWE53_04320 [Firmicutes bacterium]|nr:hypothetical protein [Bacillota bacterium]